MKNNKVITPNWNTITLEQYCRICEVINDTSNDLELTVKLCCIIFGNDENYYWNLNFNDMSKYTSQLSFINEEPKVNINGKFNKVIIGDTTYKVITDPKDITVAQFTDFENLTHMSDVKLQDLLSVFLIPKDVDTYNSGYDVYDVRKNIYEHCSLTLSQNILGFVVVRLSKYIKRSLLSSISKKNLTTEQMETLKTVISRLTRLIQ